MTKDEKTEKLNLRTLKQNEALIKKMSKNKMSRHVQVDNEPVFDELITHMHFDYGKEVVSRSAVEILKMVREDDF